MAEVKLDIGGRSYAIACRDGSETHLMSLGTGLAERAAKLVSQLGPQPEGRLLLMVALMMADELHEARSGSGQTHGSQPVASPMGAAEAEAAAVLARLATRFEQLAARLEAAVHPTDRAA